ALSDLLVVHSFRGQCGTYRQPRQQQQQHHSRQHNMSSIRVHLTSPISTSIQISSWG
ncbi:hypothetical protein A2U01_0116490, partial [Trifolium medium]|nr:hypothetical protein [Trifolium medium]